MKQKFSVLMSVYYKEKSNYLDRALNSIFNQTLMPNEVILVEDGLLNNELDDVISKYHKKYSDVLKVIKFQENRGLGIALHDGLLECSNEIVFRMDSDDESTKDRFEKTMKIFNSIDVDVVGGNITEYDEDLDKIISYRKVPETDKEIKKMAKKRNPINHPAVAYKKSRVVEVGNYLDMPYFEDYYLWARMMNKGCTFYNIQESILNFRGGNDMIKRRGGKKYIKPIIQFEKSLLELKIINKFECYLNIVERVFVSIMPNLVRFLFYKIVLRKTE